MSTTDEFVDYDISVEERNMLAELGLESQEDVLSILEVHGGFPGAGEARRIWGNRGPRYYAKYRLCQ